MRFLTLAIITILGLSAPADATSIQEKLQSLASRLASDASLETQGVACSTATASSACNAISGCHWYSSTVGTTTTSTCIQVAGKECSDYSAKVGCTQTGNTCTWFDQVNDDKGGKCIKGAGQDCSVYQGWSGCEQPGNAGQCIWFHDGTNPVTCVPRSVLYNSYSIDCTGRHSNGIDSTQNRNQASCATAPFKHFCKWNSDANVCQPTAK